jgi:phosphoribosyl 1,2-cyclic phosphodiesterase
VLLSVLCSGSSGNATFVESGGTGVLIDAGVSCRRIGRLLGELEREVRNVGAVLITHAHSDHTSGVRRLVRDHGVEVYAGSGVAAELGCREAGEGEVLDFGGLAATFFRVPHDSPACGVRLTDGERTAALATDLGEVTPAVLERLLGAEAVVLEANHDADWLRTGPYPWDLKRRISSGSGHLSNHQAAEAALRLAPHGLKDLVLAHLSKTNNSPARARGTVRHRLRSAGFAGVRVQVARRSGPIPWIEVGSTPEQEGEYRYVAESRTRLFEIGQVGEP